MIQNKYSFIQLNMINDINIIFCENINKHKICIYMHDTIIFINN